mgnify:CR=1 FL=1
MAVKRDRSLLPKMRFHDIGEDGPTLGSVGGHSLINVGYSGYPADIADLVTGDLPRVSGPVQAFVVVQRRMGRDGSNIVAGGEEAPALSDMSLYEAVLLVREFVGLIHDLLWDQDFSYVVEERAGAKQPQLRRVQPQHLADGDAQDTYV